MEHVATVDWSLSMGMACQHTPDSCFANVDSARLFISFLPHAGDNAIKHAASDLSVVSRVVSVKSSVYTTAPCLVTSANEITRYAKHVYIESQSAENRDKGQREYIARYSPTQTGCLG